MVVTLRCLLLFGSHFRNADSTGLDIETVWKRHLVSRWTRILLCHCRIRIAIVYRMLGTEYPTVCRNGTFVTNLARCLRPTSSWIGGCTRKCIKTIIRERESNVHSYCHHQHERRWKCFERLPYICLACLSIDDNIAWWVDEWRFFTRKPVLFPILQWMEFGVYCGLFLRDFSYDAFFFQKITFYTGS